MTTPTPRAPRPLARFLGLSVMLVCSLRALSAHAEESTAPPGAGETAPDAEGEDRGQDGSPPTPDSSDIDDDAEVSEVGTEEPCECDDDSAGDSGSYVLEDIEIRGNRRTRDAVILRELDFEPGQVLDLDDPRIELSRYRLLATGYFASVDLSLRRGARRGQVVLVVEVEERWTFVIRELFLGVSEISPYGGLHLDEINLLGLGISLNGAFVASRDQQAYRVGIAVPRFLESPLALSFEFLYNDAVDYLGQAPVVVTGREGTQPYAELGYSRIGGSLGTGVHIGRSFDLALEYRLEIIRASLPDAAAQLDPTLGVGEPIDFHLQDGRSVLSAFVLSLDWDTRDHPFLPSRGQHVAVTTTVSSDLIGSNYHFFKLTLQADLYVRFRWRHSLHFRLLLGSIFGRAPLYEMYFVGDLSDQNHSRVLDLNFSHEPPPNLFSNSVEEMRYETLAGRLDVEYTVPLYRGRRVVYGLDFFLLVGVYALGSAEDFRSPPGGYSGGAFPFDLTLDLGFRLDTTAGVFGFSFKNLLGLIPFSEE